jgi:MraZ protein
MLRGSQTTRIDEKGRLKIPAGFRRHIEEQFGSGVYITSLDGMSALVYPMKVWEEIEAKLAGVPDSEPAKEKFLDLTSYYGLEGEIDGQGRILIHPRLRDSARITGEVDVTGKQKILQIRPLDSMKEHISNNPWTLEDKQVFAGYNL